VNPGPDNLTSTVANVSIRILGVNTPPIAFSQSVTTEEGQPVTIVLQGYDSNEEDLCK